MGIGAEFLDGSASGERVLEDSRNGELGMDLVDLLDTVG